MIKPIKYYVYNNLNRFMFRNKLCTIITNSTVGMSIVNVRRFRGIRNDPTFDIMIKDVVKNHTKSMLIKCK